MLCSVLAVTTVLLGAEVGPGDHPRVELIHRTPQYPLKTGKTLFTDDEIAQARKNIDSYASARDLADKMVKAAEGILEMSDEELRGLIPTPDVPRAFNVGTEGCPKCGKVIYEKAGSYPWLLDLKRPFKVKCPCCGSEFPDNDFGAYYRSGFTDQASLAGEYVDDGWGWVGPPDGHRYWFVAYANHWTLHSHVIPGAEKCALAYLCTGDARFAHKAAVILERIAVVYPAMDHHTQSRYGQLQAAQGSTYPGKIVNHIWACGNLASMALTYDAIWETIDGDTALQELTGKTGEAIRADTEASILEEGIDSVFNGKIRGNFGMHQRALAYAAIVRQNGNTDAWLDTIFAQSGGAAATTGTDYALYNLVFRDGFPCETSPGYNSIWVTTLTDLAEPLRNSRWNLYAQPKMKRLYDAVLDIINAGRFTPALGDSGSVNGGLVTRLESFQAAYRAYGDPRYLAHLAGQNALGENSFTTGESLFGPALENGSVEGVPPSLPRLLDGYGMAILSNPLDTISLSLYYGYSGGHGHFDRLGFELFAAGQPIMPDLGYPDFMNGHVPGIYTWSKNTISHNTVTVDASRQAANEAGTVEFFSVCPFARVVSINAPTTYPQCSTYRRCLVMVDAGDSASYFVDWFDVAGGTQHDYSLHGPPGACNVTGGEWARQEKGTLAGEDVELARIYDDPARAVEGYTGTYYGYTGSGFQHLFNVQRLVHGEWFADWTHGADPNARLRIRVLSPPDTEAILADAQVSPVKQKQLLRYLIARRKGEALSSRFAAVLEPYTGEPFVTGARRIDLGADAAGAVITLADGRTDIVLHNPGGAAVVWAELGIETDARVLVMRMGPSGQPESVFACAASYTRVGDCEFTPIQVPSGHVRSVEPQACRVHVALDAVPDGFQADSLVGRVIHFENRMRRTAHPVAQAELAGNDLVLTTRDDLLIGRARVTAVEPQALRTDTQFAFAPIYHGAYASTTAFDLFLPVESVAPPAGEPGAIRLASPLPEDSGFAAGEDAWLVNAGPGDTLDVPSILYWTEGAH